MIANNDLDHPETLIAVDDGSNSFKSGKSPDHWLPPTGNFHCAYLIEWVTVKATWRLTVTVVERSGIAASLTEC